jgi:stage II sporulation protein D
MKTIAKLITFWSFLLIACSVSASPQDRDISQKSKPATVKVLLHRQLPGLTLEVTGRHYIYNPLNGTQISWGIVGKRFPVTTEEYGNSGQIGIKWDEKYPSHQLRVVPGDSQSSVLVNGIQYRGCVEIYLTDGKFNVINEVDVENYLKSTLSAVFAQPLHEEVMNAISIVARTNAYFVSSRNQAAFWHVAAADVGYQGSAMVPRKHVERAVDSTRQAILLYNDAPFAATWTQNSAGKTVDFAAVFRKAISTPPGVVAPIAAKDRQQYKWTCSLSKSFLAQTTDLPRITGVDLYLTPQAEKVYAVKVTDGSHVKDFDFATFQKIIGANKLRSNDFKVATKGDEFIFTGYGEGPGVGLCLYSAKAMAEQGKKATEILEAFFPQTKLEKVKILN